MLLPGFLQGSACDVEHFVLAWLIDMFTVSDQGLGC
jgi:hypothetical protein